MEEKKLGGERRINHRDAERSEAEIHLDLEIGPREVVSQNVL